MIRSKKRIILLGISILLVLLLGFFAISHQANNSQEIETKKNSTSSKIVAHTKKTKTVSTASQDQVKPTPSYRMYNGQKVVDWYKTTGAHPNLSNVPANQLKIVVDKKTQTLSIYQNNKLVSKMLISTGIATNNDNTTPSGTFQLQPEHGKWFYNPKQGVEEGAWNWISFKDHGVYLFHSVPCDRQQKPVPDKMGKLGHRNSHGCVQMSFPDNQWFYDTFANKVGTQVIVK